jgi:PD-(D/E)XK nuclease superfamily
MSSPDFPLVWDNSMRSSFIECPRKFLWESLLHFKPRGESVHLHAGKAWASALESTRRAFYSEGKSPLFSIARGIKTPVFTPPERGSGAAKSLDRLLEAFAYYWKAFPLETDPAQPFRTPSGEPMVEFSFALPIDEKRLRHPVTGEPIIYAGRADMIATYAGGVSVYDDKTTSALGSQWASQWNRRAQFTGYTWAARAFGIPATQVLVRGIAILKTEIKHAECITVRTPHHVAEWHEQFVRDVLRAIEAWKEGYWDLNLSDGCSSFGGCHFQQPCMSANPQPWLEGQFIQKKWDPVTRTETIIPIHSET